jgi:type IV pilus assembly protein PilE
LSNEKKGSEFNFRDSDPLFILGVGKESVFRRPFGIIISSTEERKMEKNGTSYNDPNDSGFSLVELIIIVATIAILSAIAFPQFTVYRTRTLNTAAQSDLKNAALAQEVYYQNNRIYCSTVSSLTGLTYGLYLSEGVSLNVISADSNGYTMAAYHEAGTVTYTLAGPLGKISK